MRHTSHANDFVNAKSHARKNLCSQRITTFLWLTFTKFSLLRSTMKSRSHKIDNCNKLSLRQSVMMHPFRPSSILALFFRERKFKYLHLPPLLPPSNLPFTLIDVWWTSLIFLRVPWSSLRGSCLDSLYNLYINLLTFLQGNRRQKNE